METGLWHTVTAKFRALKSNRVARNAGAIIGGRVAQGFFGFLVGLFTARYLGPSNYGLISYAAAYTAFFSTASSLGTNNLLVKEFVDQPESEGTIIGSTIIIRLLASLLAISIIVAASFVIDAGEPLTILIVAVTSLSLLFQQPAEVFDYWFQAKLESRITAIATLISYTVATGFKVYLLVTHKSVVYFAIVSSLDFLCLGLLLARWYKRFRGSALRCSFAYGKKLLQKSYPLILSGMMFAIYSQVDKLMLKNLAGEAETGYYAIACSFCTMWCFVLSAIITSYYPVIMTHAKAQDEAMFQLKNKQLYAIIFYVSSAVSIVLTVFASPIVRLLYGEHYLPSIPLVQIVTWYTSFTFLSSARAAWTVAKGLQKYLFKINLLSAVTNVLLNLLLIPPMGAAGAALASLISHILITLIFPLFMKDMRSNSLLMIDAILLKGLLWKKDA